jgi:general nucleoside transport system permease protein
MKPRALLLNCATVLLVLVGVAIVGAGLFLAIGVSPIEAAEAYWEGSFGAPPQTGQTLTQAVPLLLVALGWIIAFRAGRIHVGFPGQIIAGGLLTTFVALHLTALPPFFQLLLAMLAGVVGGAIYAGIAAILWAKRGVQEIVSTLLLNLIAVQLITWALHGPLQQAGGGQPQSEVFPSSIRWPAIPGMQGESLSWDIILVPVFVAAVVVLFRYTTLGYRLRLVGANPVAARWAGYKPVTLGAAAIVISGAFAGLAGTSLLLAGQAPSATVEFEAGYGFDGIAVALLARNSPVGAIFAAIFFAAISVGSGTVEATLDVPSSIASILQGVVILFVLLSVALIRRGGGQGQEAEPGAQAIEPPGVSVMNATGS